MSTTARIGQGLLVVMSLMSMVISISVFFVEDPFAHDAQVLIASFGVGMGVLTLVLAVAGLSSGQRWPWLALWVMPVFFASHVVGLGTVVPDGVLLVLSAAALVATRPRTSAAEPTPSPAPRRTAASR
jgi:hypothetical protein